MKLLFYNNDIKFDIHDIISENEELFKELEKNNLNLENVNNKITSFFDVNIYNSIICLKRDLLLTDLSIFFNNIYFNDKYFYFLFLSINENYIKYENSNNSQIYNNPYFKIEKLKKLKPLISHYLPINDNGLLFYGDNFYYPNEIILICDCELITNKDIIFGTLKITKQYI